MNKKLIKRKGGTLTKLHEKPFKTEREIQQTTEQNLETTPGLRYVKSELTFNNLRIDSPSKNNELFNQPRAYIYILCTPFFYSLNNILIIHKHSKRCHCF